jgi:hypothetical protein
VAVTHLIICTTNLKTWSSYTRLHPSRIAAFENTNPLYMYLKKNNTSPFKNS